MAKILRKRWLVHSVPSRHVLIVASASRRNHGNLYPVSHANPKQNNHAHADTHIRRGAHISSCRLVSGFHLYIARRRRAGHPHKSAAPHSIGYTNDALCNGEIASDVLPRAVQALRRRRPPPQQRGVHLLHRPQPPPVRGQRPRPRRRGPQQRADATHHQLLRHGRSRGRRPRRRAHAQGTQDAVYARREAPLRRPLPDPAPRAAGPPRPYGAGAGGSCFGRSGAGSCPSSCADATNPFDAHQPNEPRVLRDQRRRPRRTGRQDEVDGGQHAKPEQGGGSDTAKFCARSRRPRPRHHQHHPASPWQRRRRRQGRQGRRGAGKGGGVGLLQRGVRAAVQGGLRPGRRRRRHHPGLLQSPPGASGVQGAEEPGEAAGGGAGRVRAAAGGGGRALHAGHGAAAGARARQAGDARQAQAQGQRRRQAPAAELIDQCSTNIWLLQ